MDIFDAILLIVIAVGLTTFLSSWVLTCGPGQFSYRTLPYRLRGV